MYNKSAMRSKKCWDTLKPFLASKGFVHKEKYSYKSEGQIYHHENELSKSFNFAKLILSKILQRKIPIKIGSFTGNKDEPEVFKERVEK